MENYHKIFPEVKLSQYTNGDLPAFIGERRLLSFRKSSNPNIYKEFLNNLSIYTQKVPDSFAKDSVLMLMNHNMINLGRDLSNSKNGINGTVFITKANHLAGIVIDTAELDIDPSTGETSNIDNVFYALYFQTIRSAVLINRDTIKFEEDINSLCIKYLNLLMLKLLGSNIYFNEKEKSILNILVTYFYYRFQTFQMHPKAKELAFNGFTSDIEEELSPLIDNLEKYQSMNNIFKALIDLKLYNDDPHILLQLVLRKLKPLGFYSITTSLDYLIAFIIISQLPTNFTLVTTINSALQSNLEKLIYKKYITKIKFDTAAIA